MKRITPSPISDRNMPLMRCLGHCGPLYFHQIERALPVFIPDLQKKQTRQRLLYRELAKLTKSRLVGSRRPRGCRASAYYLTKKGAEKLEAFGHGQVDLSVVQRFFDDPFHEEILHGFTVEVLRARHLSPNMISEVAWSLVERFEFESPNEGGKKAYEPDAMLWLTLMDKRELTVLLEVDRGTETLTRWREKMSKTDLVLQAQEGRSRLLVITETTGRLKSLMAESTKVLSQESWKRSRWIPLEDFSAEMFFEAKFLAYSEDGKALYRKQLLPWKSPTQVVAAVG